ncbi:MAG: hypothetical protein NC827_00995 [Candidatus Omnitrophica bacterium]|nr:hypothetical protein [Candidatus Omnitrophota bacterium]MCM8801879.1 hypothetical protein [Candidatus Omnitrophota bacterium]
MDKIKQAEKIAISNKQTIYFFFNLDENSFWFGNDEENQVEPIISNFDFYKGKNEIEEKNSGTIFFKIKPNGKKDFMLLYIYDSEKNLKYTLFSNPFSDIEILKGEINFENI